MIHLRTHPCISLLLLRELPSSHVFLMMDRLRESPSYALCCPHHCPSVVDVFDRCWGVLVLGASSLLKRTLGTLLCLFASVFSERHHPFLAFSGPSPRVTDLHRSVTPWDCLFRRSQLYFGRRNWKWNGAKHVHTKAGHYFNIILIR